ncbi:GNAT family N-acetyltransferase [Streptomyces sp. NPDC004376]
MDIAVCRAADVPLLDRALPGPGRTSFHARRFARQRAGECTYLVAWLGGRPVGSAEMRWIGCAAPEVALDCPEIGGVAVRPEERSRGIGTALIRACEELARERGLEVVGIGVAEDNPRAAALYARLGYRPLVRYADRYAYVGADGRDHECVDMCTFLTRRVGG